MSGLEGRANILKGIQTTTREMKTDIKAHVVIDSWDIAEKGKEAARTVILNTPSALNPYKLNRKLTGTMLGAVDTNVTQSGNQTTAKAGWVYHQERYFAIQDQGGMGYDDYAGLFITPMDALKAAKEAMKAEAARRGYTLE